MSSDLSSDSSFRESEDGDSSFQESKDGDSSIRTLEGKRSYEKPATTIVTYGSLDFEEANDTPRLRNDDDDSIGEPKLRKDDDDSITLLTEPTTEYKCDVPGCQFEARKDSEIKYVRMMMSRHKVKKHGFKLPFYRCTEKGCDFKGKNYQIIIRHRQHIHGIGVQWYPCDQLNCNYKGKVRMRRFHFLRVMLQLNLPYPVAARCTP